MAGHVFGPWGFEEVEALVRDRRMTLDDFISTDGQSWTRVSDVREFQSLRQSPPNISAPRKTQAESDAVSNPTSNPASNAVPTRPVAVAPTAKATPKTVAPPKAVRARLDGTLHCSLGDFPIEEVLDNGVRILAANADVWTDGAEMDIQIRSAEFPKALAFKCLVSLEGAGVGNAKVSFEFIRANPNSKRMLAKFAPSAGKDAA